MLSLLLLLLMRQQYHCVSITEHLLGPGALHIVLLSPAIL